MDVLPGWASISFGISTTTVDLTSRGEWSFERAINAYLGSIGTGCLKWRLTSQKFCGSPKLTPQVGFQYLISVQGAQLITISVGEMSLQPLSQEGLFIGWESFILEVVWSVKSIMIIPSVPWDCIYMCKLLSWLNPQRSGKARRLMVVSLRATELHLQKFLFSAQWTFFFPLPRTYRPPRPGEFTPKMIRSWIAPGWLVRINRLSVSKA